MRAGAGVPAKRSLGQNFLRARWVARIFAEWACRHRRLLEIGVGTGFLTREVLGRCSPEILVGVEIDERLVPEMATLQLLGPSFQPIHADAVRPPLRLAGFDGVYGSVPYNITGPLLGLLAVEYGGPSLLLLQREVVDRLSARPGGRSYGRITVLIQLVYNVHRGPVVPPSAFSPPPRVYSRIVELSPRESRPSKPLLKAVEELTRCMFSMRNKKAVKAARRCGLQDVEWLGEKRVYELSPEEFLRLAEGRT